MAFKILSLEKTQQFDIIKNNKCYIQLLHVGRLHWVCVAGLASGKNDNSECQVYDSLSNGKVSSDLASQIAAFSMCKSAEIILEIKSVQQQTNSVDCGLFAIAFATSLAHGEDPTTTTYDTTLKEETFAGRNFRGSEKPRNIYISWE